MEIIYKADDLLVSSDTDTMLTTIAYKGKIIPELTSVISERDAIEMAKTHQMLAFIEIMAKNIYVTNLLAENNKIQ